MKVRLGDIGKIITGTTPSTSNHLNFSSNDIFFIKPSDFKSEKLNIISQSEHYISECARNKARIVPPGSVLVTCIGEIGKVAINETECAFNQQINAIIPDQNICNSIYLGYAIQSIRNILKIKANAPVVPILNKTQFSAIEIDIPSMPIQNKVIKQLQLLDKMSSAKECIISKLDQLVKSRFMEMFGEWPANSRNWPTGQIKDIVIDVKYGSSRPSSRDGKYPYLRMNNITYSGQLDLSDIKKITIPDNELENCSARKGDVLFNRTNSKELVGKTCVYNQEQPMVIAGFIIRVRLNETLMSPVFLSSFLNTDFSKHMLMHKCKSAIGQANINAQEMKNIKLYIPPLPLQQQFAAFVEKVDKSKFIVGARLAGRLCRKILTKLSLSEADYD